MLNIRWICILVLYFGGIFLSHAQQNNLSICDSLTLKARLALDTRADLALLYSQLALKFFDAKKPDRCYLTALRYMGLAYLALGDQNKGKNYILQSYLLSRKMNDSVSWSASASNLFHYYFYYGGDAKKAEQYLNEAYVIDIRLKDTSSIAIHLMNYGELAFMKGNVRRALLYFQNAAQLEASLHNASGVADAYVNIALAWLTLGDTTQGISYLKQAYDIYKLVDEKANIALAATNLASLYATRGQCTKAKAFIQEALMARENAADKKSKAQSYFVYAKVLQCEGKIDEAEEWFFRASQLALEIQNFYQLATAFYEQAQFYLFKRDTAKTIEYLKNSLEFAYNIEYQTLIDTTLIQLAHLHAHLGLWEKAYSYLLRADKDVSQKTSSINNREQSLRWKKLALIIFISESIIILFCIIIIIIQYRMIRKIASEKKDDRLKRSDA